ncbi:MAG: hypothetical protein ACI4VP_03580 [Clostridia bacterium]
MKVTFTGKQEDDYGRLQFNFEAKEVSGFECSTIIFALNSDGRVVMGSKYFRELPRLVQTVLIVKAQKLLPV